MVPRGDPTVLGWATAALYLVAAAFAARAAWRAPDRQLRAFWGLSALALASLGVNKQLDVQTDLMRVARAVVTDTGLHPAYTTELKIGVGALAALGLLGAAAAVAWLARGRWRRLWLPSTGWLAIALFVALRAAAFHDLDELGVSFLKHGAVRALELGGLAAVVVGSLRAPPVAGPASKEC